MTRAPALPVCRYRADLHALDDIHLPPYSGSAWRGLFGHALKRAVCVTREPECADCLLYRSCVYAYVFKTPPPADANRMRRYTEAPHPYVFAPDWRGAPVIPAGQSFALDFSLFGRAHQHLPYVLHALSRAGRAGFKHGRGRFRITSLDQRAAGGGEWRTVYHEGGELRPLTPEQPVAPKAPDGCTISLLTPLRLKDQGRLSTPERFAFHHLFRNLLRRISMLMYFHTGAELEVDFRALSQAARDIELATGSLTWAETTRHSARQQTTMQMGGLLGEFTLEGDLEAFWPYLWLGQYTHAGRFTSMGLGRYRIESASLPNAGS